MPKSSLGSVVIIVQLSIGSSVSVSEVDVAAVVYPEQGMGFLLLPGSSGLVTSRGFDRAGGEVRRLDS